MGKNSSENHLIYACENCYGFHRKMTIANWLVDYNTFDQEMLEFDHQEML